MVYETRVGDVFTLGTTSWRVEQITHDQVLVSPAPGSPGRLPFWKGDAPPPAAGAGPRLRRVRPRARQPRARRGRTSGCGRPASTSSRPATCSATWPSSRRRPPRCPPTRPSWSSGSATSSATGGCAALAASAPAVLTPWALAIEQAARRAVRDGGAGHRHQRRHRAAHPRHRVRTAQRRPDGRRPGAARVGRHRRGRRVGAVRRPVPGVRRAGAAAAPPRPQVAVAAVAAADAVGPAADRRRAVPGVPHRAGDDAGVPDRRVRPGRADRGAAPDRRPHHPAGRGGDQGAVAVRQARCCSATSGRSSTRATSRWPRRRPPPCRWTPILLAELLGKDGLKQLLDAGGDRRDRGRPAGTERGAAGHARRSSCSTWSGPPGRSPAPSSPIGRRPRPRLAVGRGRA